MPRISLRDRVKSFFRGQKRARSTSPRLQELSLQKRQERQSVHLRYSTLDPTEPSTSRAASAHPCARPDIFQFSIMGWPERAISTSSSSLLDYDTALERLYHEYISGCDGYQKMASEIVESSEHQALQCVHPTVSKSKESTAPTVSSSVDYKDAIDDAQEKSVMENSEILPRDITQQPPYMNEERKREQIIQGYMKQHQDNYTFTRAECEGNVLEIEDKSAQVSITLDTIVSAINEETRRSSDQASNTEEPTGARDTKMSIAVDSARIELNDVSTQVQKSSSKTKLVIVGQSDSSQGVTVNIAENLRWRDWSSGGSSVSNAVRNMPINITGQNVYINIGGNSRTSNQTCPDSSFIIADQEDISHNILTAEDDTNVGELESQQICQISDEMHETGDSSETNNKQLENCEVLTKSLSSSHHSAFLCLDEDHKSNPTSQEEIVQLFQIGTQSSGQEGLAEQSTTLSGILVNEEEETNFLSLDDILKEISDVQPADQKDIGMAEGNFSKVTKTAKTEEAPFLNIDEHNEPKAMVRNRYLVQENDEKPIDNCRAEITTMKDPAKEHQMDTESSSECCSELPDNEESHHMKRHADATGADGHDNAERTTSPSEVESHESITLRVERLSSDSLASRSYDQARQGQVLELRHSIRVPATEQQPGGAEAERDSMKEDVFQSSESTSHQQEELPVTSDNQTSQGCQGIPIVQTVVLYEMLPSTDVDNDQPAMSNDDMPNRVTDVDDRVSDESGLVDVYRLTRQAQFENYQLQKSFAKFRSKSEKMARLHKYLEQLRGEREEMKNLLTGIDRQTAALRHEAAEMRCTVTAVCDMSVAAIGKETEARRLEPACYRRYLNIRNPSDATNALTAVRNRIKALNDLEVLIYRKQLVLHHVLPSSTQEKTSAPKRVYRPAHKGPKPKRSEQSGTTSQLSTGNIIIEVVSPVAEPRTPSWSEEVSHTESPSISTPVSVSNEATGSGHHLPDTEV